MRAYFKGIYSIDLPNGPPQLPDDPENCWIVVHADIGGDEGPAADTFMFYVCTPKKLRDILEKTGFQLGRNLILVNEFNWNVVERAIKKLVETFEGDDWEALANKIGRYGQWEFEDFAEYIELT